MLLTRDNYVDAARALYWYATEWHSGQDSTLYSILSTLGYSPGASERGVDDEDESGEWYRALEAGLSAQTLADAIKLIGDTP